MYKEEGMEQVNKRKTFPLYDSTIFYGYISMWLGMMTKKKFCLYLLNDSCIPYVYIGISLGLCIYIYIYCIGHRWKVMLLGNTVYYMIGAKAEEHMCDTN